MKLIITANIALALTGLVYNVWTDDNVTAWIWFSALCGWIIGLFGEAKP
jgi:hypothetical protein